ncbi:MAG: CapA family protein [Alistipes sp.]|jgi:poly-gamma-glutamate synthesis protein (capsule biosynthesis protein)|nr:CapA family protein [Alistipes sp.]
MRRALQFSGFMVLVGVVCTMVGAGCGSRQKPATSDPEPAPQPVVRTAKLLFIGDVMSHAPQVAAARTLDGYDYTETFRHFGPIFGQTDIAVANLETTLRTTPPYTGYPMFAAPAELAFGMRRAGIDIVTTANNHILDRGARGVRSTLAILDSAGIRHTGAFLDSADRRARNPLRFTAGGLNFALLAYTYGTNGIPVPKGVMVNLIDTAVIASDLAAALAPDPTLAQKPDHVIVAYHWGEEYRVQPTRAQRELAAWTRAHGADLIIGGHPHVVEPMEAHLDADSNVVGATYYSLGNFVSNQRTRRTDGGIAARITITRTDPPTSDSTGITPGAAHGMAHEAAHRTTHTDWDLGWSAGWVHIFERDGLRRYEVLPAAALDTLHSSGLDTLPAARTFLSDTRALLSADSLFREVQIKQ